jgi:hypothetical protein
LAKAKGSKGLIPFDPISEVYHAKKDEKETNHYGSESSGRNKVDTEIMKILPEEEMLEEV